MAVVALYTFVAFLQFKEMGIANFNQSITNINTGVTADRTLNQAEQNLQIDQRAWVGLDEPMVAKIINYPGPKFTWSNGSGVIHKMNTPNPLIHTAVSMKNFGKTPAFDVVVSVWPSAPDNQDNISKAECQVAEDFSTGKVVKEQPHKGNTWPTFGNTMFPGQETIKPQNIPGGDIGRLFIMGCIAYRDAFNHRHKTRFCYMSPQVFVSDPPMKNGDAFVQCSQFNDAN